MKQQAELPGLSEEIKLKNGKTSRALCDKIEALRRACVRQTEDNEEDNTNTPNTPNAPEPDDN